MQLFFWFLVYISGIRRVALHLYKLLRIISKGFWNIWSTSQKNPRHFPTLSAPQQWQMQKFRGTSAGWCASLLTCWWIHQYSYPEWIYPCTSLGRDSKIRGMFMLIRCRLVTATVDNLCHLYSKIWFWYGNSLCMSSHHPQWNWAICPLIHYSYEFWAIFNRRLKFETRKLAQVLI